MNDLFVAGRYIIIYFLYLPCAGIDSLQILQEQDAKEFSSHVNAFHSDKVIAKTNGNVFS